MYIEFGLLDHGYGSAGYALDAIKQAVEKWSQKYEIPFTKKTVKYTHRVCFDDDKYYSFFATTFSPPGDHAFWHYRIVTDRNNPI